MQKWEDEQNQSCRIPPAPHKVYGLPSRGFRSCYQYKSMFDLESCNVMFKTLNLGCVYS